MTYSEILCSLRTALAAAYLFFFQSLYDTDNAGLVLDLPYIKAGCFETVFLHDIVLNLRISRCPGLSLKLRNIQIDISVDFFPT